MRSLSVALAVVDRLQIEFSAGSVIQSQRWILKQWIQNVSQKDFQNGFSVDRLQVPFLRRLIGLKSGVSTKSLTDSF